MSKPKKPKAVKAWARFDAQGNINGALPFKYAGFQDGVKNLRVLITPLPRRSKP